MKVQVDPGMNWTWFKVQDGDLVANFRLHHGSEALAAFYNLKKGKMTEVRDIESSWRDESTVVANHWKIRVGYDLPEVVEKFGWLGDMFRSVADPTELSSCASLNMRHLEYHGVSILKVQEKE